MCPKTYIAELSKFQGIDNLDAIYRVKRGSAVHEELQSDILSSDKLYDRVELEKLMPKDMVIKMSDKWPEVPFYHSSSGISGRLDCLMDWQGPVPVEIKTTSIPIDRWEKDIESRLPMPQHICQGAIYCYMLNTLGYVNTPITRFVLAYINLMAPPGDQKAEKEYILNYDTDLADKVQVLVSHLAANREVYIEGIDIPCTYPLCKTHRKKDNDQ